VIEPGEIVKIKDSSLYDSGAQQQVFVGIVIEVRTNALWGLGSATVLCDNGDVRDFGAWEMCPVERLACNEEI